MLVSKLAERFVKGDTARRSRLGVSGPGNRHPNGWGNENVLGDSIHLASRQRRQEKVDLHGVGIACSDSKIEGYSATHYGLIWYLHF